MTARPARQDEPARRDRQRGSGREHPGAPWRVAPLPARPPDRGPARPAAVNLAAFGHVPAGGSRVRLESLQVAATSPPGMLATYRGDQIVPLLLVIGADRPTGTLEPGQTAVVFLDLTFPRTGNIPRTSSTGSS